MATKSKKSVVVSSESDLKEYEKKLNEKMEEDDQNCFDAVDFLLLCDRNVEILSGYSDEDFSFTKISLDPDYEARVRKWFSFARSGNILRDYLRQFLKLHPASLSYLLWDGYITPREAAGYLGHHRSCREEQDVVVLAQCLGALLRVVWKFTFRDADTTRDSIKAVEAGKSLVPADILDMLPDLFDQIVFRLCDGSTRALQAAYAQFVVALAKCKLTRCSKWLKDDTIEKIKKSAWIQEQETKLS